MTQRLRDELEQLAERTPSLSVPTDTWSRGRRARRRDRLAAGAAALALVATTGGLASLLAGPAEVAPAGQPPGGAVPTTIHGVPDHLQGVDEQGRFTGPLSPTLAVGRGSVAFVTPGGLPVLVDAADGEHQLLDLPDWPFGDLMAAAWIEESDSQPLALSPDGRRLAWSWARPGGRTATAEVPSGVRVADLGTGEVRTIRLDGTGLADGAQAVQVRSLGWSPDSRWLVWAGVRLAQWNAGGMSGTGGAVAGRIAPDATTSEALPTTREANVSWSVASDGDVVRAGQGSGIQVVAGRGPAPFGGGAALAVTPIGAVSPDGTRAALGRFPMARSALVADLERRQVRPRVLPAQVAPHGAAVQPLGWLDDRTVVVWARPGDPDGQPGAPHVALVSAPDTSSDPSSDTSRDTANDTASEESNHRIVARVEPTGDPSGAVQFPTVAVDLMTSERPTRAFPAPDWPWSVERRVVVGVLSAVGLALAAYLLLWWRRRPRP